MRVAIDIRSLVEETVTGVGQYTHSLVGELIQNTSIEWYVFYNQGKKIAPPALVDLCHDIPHVHLVSTRYPNKIFNFLLSLRIFTLDRIVCARAGIPALDWFFFPNLGFISVSKHTKMMLVVHDLTFERFKQYYSLKRIWWHAILRPKRLIAHAHTIITPSRSTTEDLKLLYTIDHTRVRTIPHGRPEDVSDVAGGENTASSATPYFVAVSTIEPRKNFEGIIAAYKESGLHKHGIQLIICGGLGWRYRKVVKKFTTTPGVVYRGYVNHAEKQRLIAGALALIYPSFYEGFGLPILEAFSAGVPVITSDRSSLLEVCDGAAYLVRPHITSDIAHAMRDLAYSPELREWYRVEGRKRVVKFSWSTAAQSVLKLLQDF